MYDDSMYDEFSDELESEPKKPQWNLLAKDTQDFIINFESNCKRILEQNDSETYEKLETLFKLKELSDCQLRECDSKSSDRETIIDYSIKINFLFVQSASRLSSIYSSYAIDPYFEKEVYRGGPSHSRIYEQISSLCEEKITCYQTKLAQIKAQIDSSAPAEIKQQIDTIFNDSTLLHQKLKQFTDEQGDNVSSNFISKIENLVQEIKNINSLLKARAEAEAGAARAPAPARPPAPATPPAPAMAALAGAAAGVEAAPERRSPSPRFIAAPAASRQAEAAAAAASGQPAAFPAWKNNVA